MKNICDAFKNLNDPRVDRTKHHKMIDIITIAVCAVVSGADHFTEIENFGKAKFKWLKTFLELPYGIPSHDTFGNFFAKLDPEQFCNCFIEWINSLYDFTQGKIVAIDGKTLRKSFDKANNKAALHMVHAWSAENQILLGQVACEEKSNEITAIPNLLKMLEITGCIVTIDAMGCQKKIAKAITQKGGDYVLGLKGNQQKLKKEVETFFSCAEKAEYKLLNHSMHKTIDGAHGRVEHREYHIIEDKSFDVNGTWGGLSAVGMVRSERIIGDKKTNETRYYICSKMMCSEDFAYAVRNHWSVENNLHWVLDVSFNEDSNRVRCGHSAENFGTLRRFCLSLLNQEKQVCKLGVKSKRKRCGWDNDYLMTVILGN